MINFDFVNAKIEIDSSKKVMEIEVSLEIDNADTQVQITDIMLQGGPIVTIWTGHPSELRWQHDW